MKRNDEESFMDARKRSWKNLSGDRYGEIKSSISRRAGNFMEVPPSRDRKKSVAPIIASIMARAV